jgi:hypothetical protein
MLLINFHLNFAFINEEKAASYFSLLEDISTCSFCPYHFLANSSKFYLGERAKELMALEPFRCEGQLNL